MKTNSLLLVLALAGASSAALAPFQPVAAGLLFTAAGLCAVILADYGRVARPLRPSAQIVPFGDGRRGSHSLRRAA
jgi:hypothetical protein